MPPTKFQFRCSTEEKALWERAAGGGEESLSEWVRATLSMQARRQTAPGERASTIVIDEATDIPQEVTAADDPGDDLPPEPEELLVPPSVPPPLVVPASPGGPPDPTCRNAVYHWKLVAGEPCVFCGGSL